MNKRTCHSAVYQLVNHLDICSSTTLTTEDGCPVAEIDSVWYYCDAACGNLQYTLLPLIEEDVATIEKVCNF